LKILAEKFLNIKIQRNNKNYIKIIKKDESIEIIPGLDNRIEEMDSSKGIVGRYVYIS
jgi:hypothetical protein